MLCEMLWEVLKGYFHETIGFIIGVYMCSVHGGLWRSGKN